MPFLNAISHGALIGLDADDHPQYLNNTRGDARYFQKTEHIDESAGAADAGKPIVLDASGLIDSSMLPPGDISTAVILAPTTSARNVIEPSGTGILGLSIKESSAASGTYSVFTVGNTTKAINVQCSAPDSYVTTIPTLASTNIATTSIYIGDGTVSSPAILSLSDSDTGIYKSGANSLDFSAGGNRHLQVTYNGSSKKQTKVFGDKGTILDATGLYGFGYRSPAFDLANSAFSVYDGTDTLHVQGNEILTTSGKLSLKAYNNGSAGGAIYFYINNSTVYDPVAIANANGFGVGTSDPKVSFHGRFNTHGGMILHTRQLSGSAGSANIYFKYDTGEPNFKGNFAIAYVPNGTTSTDEYYGKLHISVRTTASDAANAGDGNAATNSVFCVDSTSGAASVNIGMGGVTSPTARLHLPAGTASAGTAPLKITTGTLLTTPETGAIEVNSGNVYFTPASTRKRLLTEDDAVGSGTEATPSSLSSDQNDWSISSGAGTIRVTASANVAVTGLANGAAARVVRIFNASTYDIVLAHESTSSTAANRFNIPLGIDVTLRPGDTYTLTYDSVSSRWRVSGYEEFLQDPNYVCHWHDDFVAGDPTGGGPIGSLDWTKNQSGSVTFAKYYAQTNCMGTVDLQLGGSSSSIGISLDPQSELDGAAILETRVRFDGLSDSTNKYQALFGAGSLGVVSASFGIMYDKNVSDNWVLYSGSYTAISSVAVAANTWYRIKVILNRQQNKLEGFINDVSIGTLINDGTTRIDDWDNIYDASPMFFAMTDTAGSPTRTLRIDYARGRFVNNTRRVN
jgi:hypothetical protein